MDVESEIDYLDDHDGIALTSRDAFALFLGPLTTMVAAPAKAA
jgi:hypothetical protein